MTEFDLTGISVVVSMIAALCSVAVMQVVTKASGFRGKRPLMALCQRASFVGLSIALIYNAYSTAMTGSQPRLTDLLVEFALMIVLVIWALRRHAFPHYHQNQLNWF